MNKTRWLLLVGIIAFVVIVVLGTCFDKTTPESELARVTQLRHDAYDYAVKCSKTETPLVKFEDITWIVMPGREMQIKAVDGTAYLRGYYSVRDTVVYVTDAYKETFWVLAHESLHAIGYIGHPVVPFRTCGLDSDQNGY